MWAVNVGVVTARPSRLPTGQCWPAGHSTGRAWPATRPTAPRGGRQLSRAFGAFGFRLFRNALPVLFPSAEVGAKGPFIRVSFRGAFSVGGVWLRNRVNVQLSVSSFDYRFSSTSVYWGPLKGGARVKHVALSRNSGGGQTEFERSQSYAFQQRVGRCP